MGGWDISGSHFAVRLIFVFSNAIKFTNTDGSVRVGAIRTHDFVKIQVTNTGKGISIEQLPHIFERFWQDKETAHKGTGLGLSIVKGLVEAQGGTVWVESQLGASTSFYFTIPLAIANKAAS